MISAGGKESTLVAIKGGLDNKIPVILFKVTKFFNLKKFHFNFYFGENRWLF
jgi:hypothetical protein